MASCRNMEAPLNILSGLQLLESLIVGPWCYQNGVLCMGTPFSSAFDGLARCTVAVFCSLPNYSPGSEQLPAPLQADQVSGKPGTPAAVEERQTAHRPLVQRVGLLPDRADARAVHRIAN